MLKLQNVIAEWICRLLSQYYDEIHLFFTITNCQIVRSPSLPHRISHKFMSVHLLTIKIAKERTRICGVIVKCFTYWGRDKKKCNGHRLKSFIVHENKYHISGIVSIRCGLGLRPKPSQPSQARNLWKHYPKSGTFSMTISSEHFHASLSPSAKQLMDIFRKYFIKFYSTRYT